MNTNHCHSVAFIQAFSAVQETRRMLSQPIAPIDAVIRSGAIPILVKFLLRDDKPDLQYEAAWALTNVVAGNTEQTQSVIDADGLTHFAQLIASQTVDVRHPPHEQHAMPHSCLFPTGPRKKMQTSNHNPLVPHCHLCILLYTAFHHHSLLNRCHWTVIFGV
jgi:hypothetical protein